MPTYLYLHKENNDLPQKEFKGKCAVRNVSYELSRTVGKKGEITSDIKGGMIKLTLEGFGDELLFNWLFRPDMQKDGEVVTLDTAERVIEKFSFEKAEALKYKLEFDPENKNNVTAELTINAGVITTDNDLYYETKK